MSKEKLDLQPRSLGERWYQYVVNQSGKKSTAMAIIPLLMGASSFALYFLANAEKPTPWFTGWLGVFIVCSVVLV